MPHASMLTHLLADFVGRWTREAASDGETDHLLYVDPFARSGGQSAPSAQPANSRAVRVAWAITEAGAAFGIRTEAWLADEDPGHVAALRDALTDAGPADGEARVIEAAPAEVLARLAAPGAQRILAVLAPPRPALLARPVAYGFAARADTDLVIALPLADLRVVARFPDMPLADLPPHPRRVVHAYSALLGDTRHRWLADWRRTEAERGIAAATEMFVDAYTAGLADAAPGAYLRHLRLGPDEPAANDANAPPVHLIYLTRNAAKVLALNEVLRALSLTDARVAERGRLAPRATLPEPLAEALDLFDLHRIAQPAARGAVDVASLAEQVVGRFSCQQTTWDEVLRWAAESDLTAAELRRAIALAKRSGRAVYRALRRGDDRVSFPTAPALPTAQHRRPDLDVPGLFGGTA